MGLTQADHAGPILLLILKMSMLRIAIFRILEDSLIFVAIEDSRNNVLHDSVPFCKSSCSWFPGLLYHTDFRLSFNLWLNSASHADTGIGIYLKGMIPSGQKWVYPSCMISCCLLMGSV